MFSTSPGARAATLAALATGLILAVSCSSSNNNSSNNKGVATAVTQAAATRSATAAPTTSGTARPATAGPATSTGGSPTAGAIAATFQAPGGAAAWSSGADGCHGVKAPAGAEAPKASDTGVTATELKLGSTFALSGPGAAYAPIIKVIQDCFNAVNADGGIYGRKINFIVDDDAYDPAKTVPLTKQLVEQDKIFADVTPLGTAPNLAIADYMNEQKVPQFYVATGAARWGADVKNLPWTIGFFVDYISEGQNYATYIQQNLKGKKVGVLRQNDSYGEDYLTGLTNVLGKSGTADNPIVDVETYAVSDTDLTGQVTNLKNKGADVFVLIATPVPAGLALKAAAAQSWKPTVILNSVGIASNLNDLAGGNQNIAGVISDAYYHTAGETSDPSVQAVQQFLQKNDTGGLQLSNFAIFGYMAGQIWVETLKRAGVNLTRASLKQAAESFQHWQIPQLLPGVDVSTSATDHRPIKCIKFLKYDDKATTSYFGDAICAKSQ